jgi:hypothetical protein
LTLKGLRLIWEKNHTAEKSGAVEAAKSGRPRG